MSLGTQEKLLRIFLKRNFYFGRFGIIAREEKEKKRDRMGLKEIITLEGGEGGGGVIKEEWPNEVEFWGRERREDGERMD